MDAFLSLTPAALFLVVLRLRRRLPPGVVWLSASFAVATVGDLWATAAGGAWWPSYLWLPVQLALAVRAVSVSDGKEYLGFWTWLGALALYDVLVVTGPDVLVTAVGSAVVTSLAMRTGGRLSVPILIYFGAGSVAYLGMVASIGGEAFMAWWWAYQACRVLGWLALAEIVRCCWFRYRVGRATVDPHHVERVSLLRFLGAR